MESHRVWVTSVTLKRQSSSQGKPLWHDSGQNKKTRLLSPGPWMIPGDMETGKVSTLEARGQAKSQPSPSAREDLKALPRATCL